MLRFSRLAEKSLRNVLVSTFRDAIRSCPVFGVRGPVRVDTRIWRRINAPIFCATVLQFTSAVMSLCLIKVGELLLRLYSRTRCDTVWFYIEHRWLVAA